MEFLIFALGVLALFIFLPRKDDAPSKRYRWRNSVFYGIFVLLVGFSPIIGGYISLNIGFELDPIVAMCFIWIGVFISLPASLLAARLFGEEAYHEYWEYLASFPRHSKPLVIKIWYRASIAAFVLGMLGLLLLR